MRKRVEGASSLDGDLLYQTAAAVRRVFPQAPEPSEVTSDSVEQVLHLVDLCLPNWTIQLTGKAKDPDRHWRCSLRESRGSDDDEVIGLGSGPVAALALADALLHVAMQKART